MAAHNTLTYIRCIIIFLIKITDRFYIRFAESLLVCAALRCILSIYKRINIFTIITVMR